MVGRMAFLLGLAACLWVSSKLYIVARSSYSPLVGVHWSVFRPPVQDWFLAYKQHGVCDFTNQSPPPFSHSWAPLYKDIPEIGTPSSLIKTLLLVPTVYKTTSDMRTPHYLIRTLLAVPCVSTMERFHCNIEMLAVRGYDLGVNFIFFFHSCRHSRAHLGSSREQRSRSCLSPPHWALQSSAVGCWCVQRWNHAFCPARESAVWTENVQSGTI